MNENSNSTQGAKTVQGMSEEARRLGTERINALVGFVCYAYGLTQHELADKLGIDRGWFMRYLKGGIGMWPWTAVINLADLARSANDAMVLDWFTASDLDE